MIRMQRGFHPKCHGFMPATGKTYVSRTRELIGPVEAAYQLIISKVYLLDRYIKLSPYASARFSRQINRWR
jgi:hypothetical protein